MGMVSIGLHYRLFCIAIVVIFAGLSRPALGAPLAKGGAWNACALATQRAERQSGLPARLLDAISRAESGRWNAESRQSVAWPWTVTSGTDSWQFDTKSEAIRQVETLQRAGRRNIDVGCMQINLYYHPDAFASLHEAFDPQANANYAGRYLKALRNETGDWSMAAATYHSRDPDRGQNYRARVMEHWRLLGGRAETLVAGSADKAATPEPAKPAPVAPVAVAKADSAGTAGITDDVIQPVDYARTEALNARFRDARITLAAADATDRAEVRHRQLDAWREAQARGVDSAHEATMRRAQLATARARELEAAARADRSRFAENRARQLQFWRSHVATQ